MNGTRKHKGQDIVIDPTRAQIKTAPVHNSRGNACNVVENCGKTAHRFHGSNYGCLDHQHLIFAMAARSRGVKVVLPEVNFEPEETGLNVPELA